MDKHKKSTLRGDGFLLFFFLASAAFANAQDSSKHLVGETVARLATIAGVDMNGCHKVKLHTWMCASLIRAEHGSRLLDEKVGDWSAVPDGGRPVSWNDNLNREN